MSRHGHVWQTLWFHLGPHADQSIGHAHQCIDGRCRHLLVSGERECRGMKQRHEVATPGSWLSGSTQPEEADG